MKFGLFGINIGPCADPEIAGRVAALAEEAGPQAVISKVMSATRALLGRGVDMHGPSGGFR